MVMKNRTFLLILSMVLCLCSCKKEEKNSGEDQPSIGQTEEIEALQTLPKTKAFYTGLLESFFSQHYGDCFKGSNYVENTVSVIKLEFADEKMEGESDSDNKAEATAPSASKQSTSDGKNEVEVVGTHTYVGPAGYQVTGQKFKAIISIAEEGFNIDVFRESTQILTSKSFWEKGAGNMIFVQ